MRPPGPSFFRSSKNLECRLTKKRCPALLCRRLPPQYEYAIFSFLHCCSKLFEPALHLSTSLIWSLRVLLLKSLSLKIYRNSCIGIFSAFLAREHKENAIKQLVLGRAVWMSGPLLLRLKRWCRNSLWSWFCQYMFWPGVSYIFGVR